MTNKYDDLDNFFKKFLNEKSIPERDWNTPSDEVWERALPQFEQNKKKKRVGIWWITGVSCLIIVLGAMSLMMFQMQHKIEQLEDQQEEILKHQAQVQLENERLEETIISQLSNNQEANTNATKNKKNANELMVNYNQPQSFISEDVNVKQIKNVQRESNLALLTSPKNDELNKEIIENKVSTEEIINEYKGEKTSSNDNITSPLVVEHSTILNEEKVEKVNISGVTSLDIEELNHATTINYSTPTIKKTREERRTFAQTFGLEVMYFSPTLMDFSRKSTAPTLLGYDRWTWSQGLGVNLVYQWNGRWAVTSGISRNSIDKQFMAYGIGKYNALESSHIRDPQVENNVILKMSSPIGEMNETFVLEQNIKKRIPHNTPIILNGCIDHNLKSVRVPIGLRYNFLKWRQLQLNLETGLGYNMITSNTYKVSYGVVIDGEVVDNNNHTIELETPISSNMWDGIVTVGLQQRIGKYFNLTSNMSYTQSLHPMSNNISEYETTYWRGLRVQMGLGYTF